jgi:hypothetical protein
MLTATRHVSVDVFEKNMEVIKNAYGEALYFSGAPSAESYTKGACLAMLGLYNANKQYSYKQTQGFYEIDAGAGVKMRRRMEDGSFIFTSSTELVGLFSMAPWGRIALDVGSLRQLPLSNGFRCSSTLLVPMWMGSSSSLVNTTNRPFWIRSSTMCDSLMVRRCSK